MKLNLPAQKLTSISGIIAVIVLCLTGIVALQQDRLQLKSSHLTISDYLREEQTQKASLSLIKNLPAFGFSNLIADWNYLKFIQYFGDSPAREKIGYSLTPNYFEAIVKRDPKFIQAYLTISPANSIFAGYPQKSVALLEQGLKSISPQKSSLYCYLWIYKGVDELLFLGKTQAAKQSYERAVQCAASYNDPSSQSLAANVQQTVQFFSTNPDSRISQIGAWTMVISVAPDKKTQQRAISQIKALGGEVYINSQGRLRVRVPDKTEK